MADYSRHGYDMIRQPRCFYAFLSADGERVKIGMVGRQTRLSARLAEVTSRSKEPGLRMVAWATAQDLNEHEAEDTEAALRLWLTSTTGLTHSGLVDWLLVPPRSELDWQQLVERGLAAIASWHVAS